MRPTFKKQDLDERLTLKRQCSQTPYGVSADVIALGRRYCH